MRPYALEAGQGWTYHLHGIDFALKAPEEGGESGVAVLEYATRQGEEPPDHVHPNEDEIFYVLDGRVGFHCGGESFELGPGGFMFLPRGIEHGYTIRSEQPARLLIVTAPSEPARDGGWGGFIGDVARQGEPLAAPE